MGTNIPRPTRRPPTPKMIVKCDGIIGAKTKDEILEYLNTGLTINDHRRILGLDPVEEVNPVPMVPRMADRVPGVHRTNCPNCCAVITGPICEYCGTRFEDRQVCLPITVSAEEAAEVFRRWNETVFGVNPCRDVQAPKLPTQKQR